MLNPSLLFCADADNCMNKMHTFFLPVPKGSINKEQNVNKNLVINRMKQLVRSSFSGQMYTRTLCTALGDLIRLKNGFCVLMSLDRDTF